ncbi:MAG: hypothetical protein B6D61_15175 [Bacteroidetes bacterium 4484_249]|nr:MAG: hypothetical protein B6D61_15175 [Bacteroidetes bacterium 4484_249]
MKLKHIAFTVDNSAEIDKFYKGLLGMKEEKSFVLNRNLARDIFGIEKETSAFLLKKDELFFEIFILPKKLKKDFNHICISVADRKNLVIKAEHENFEVIRIKREFDDLIFIKDNSGNIFEIKES